jgi:L-fucose isomerase
MDGALTMQIFKYMTGEPVLFAFDRTKMGRLGAMATPQWPVAFTMVKSSPEGFLNNYPCNHIHGVYGDFFNEWLFAAKILGIDVQILG